MVELRERPGDQPLPTPNYHPAIADIVIADIKQRREIGIQRYGVPLQPHNGRDALRDAYEETLDMAVYIKQAIVERDSPAPGIELPHVARLRSATYGTPAPLDVHRTSAVLDHGAALPAVGSREEFVNLLATTLAHERSQLVEQRHDGIDVRILPGPDDLAVLALRVAGANGSRASDLADPSDDVFVGHAHDDANQRPWCAVLVVAGCQVEASLAFKEPGEPCGRYIIHSAHCSNETSCMAFDLACYIRQAIYERGQALSEPADGETPYECTVCGEVRTRGSFSEHDNGWICDDCHTMLSRGGDLADALPSRSDVEAQAAQTPWSGIRSPRMDDPDAQDGYDAAARAHALVDTFLRVSGLTPREAGALFGVSANAVNAWSTGAAINSDHYERLAELNRRTQEVRSKSFYGRRYEIMRRVDEQPSIYQRWLAEVADGGKVVHEGQGDD